MTHSSVDHPKPGSVLLVTGGSGFVLSHTVKRWAEQHPQSQVIVLDNEPMPDDVNAFFSDVVSRIEFLTADVRDAALWQSLSGRVDIGYVVHGATVTSIRRHLDVEGTDKPRLSGARPSMDTNIGGTLNALQWAQTLPNLKRMVYVSSGSVYADAGPDDGPMPEDGYVLADDLYAISKYSSEMFANFCRQQLELPVVSVRLSGVYGPMDRTTGSRDVDCIPKVIAQRAVGGTSLTTRSLAAVGDFVHAADVADAIISLLEETELSYPVYNIAAGELVSVGDLVRWAGEVWPGFNGIEQSCGEVDINYVPEDVSGRYGAYDVSRLREDTGWQPRQTRDAFKDYLSWLTTQE